MKLYCPITIDLYKVYPLQVMEAQQGNVGRGAIVTLTAGSAVIDPMDETVEVYAKTPDGTVSWLECSVEDGKIKIDFTNQMLMSPGILQVELRMKDDGDDITTPIFKVKVNKSNVQSAGRSENELPLLDQIKKNAEDAKAAAEAAEKAVGDKITNPGIGAVGQILEVESVDEKGKPLTYKAVDKPEGGVDKELSQIIHASRYGIVSDGFSDTVIVIGKDAAAGDVIKYVIEENSGDITVIYDNNDTGEFNITTIDHAGEAAGEKTLTAEKYCTYTFPSEMDVYLPFNIPAKTSQLTDDVGFAKQEEVSKLSEDKVDKPLVAKVGQIISVKAVDENGKPSEFESVDLPSGGTGGTGGKEWELFSEIEITEPIEKIVFENIDSDSILLTTKGLKTDKTSSMGVLADIDGTEGNLKQLIVHQRNVFKEITTQQGFMVIKELVNGFKYSINVLSPQVPTLLSANAKIEIDTTLPYDLKIGKINRLELYPSEINYPITGGKVWLYIER